MHASLSQHEPISERVSRLVHPSLQDLPLCPTPTQTDRQTDRQTDQATASVTMHLASTATRPKSYIGLQLATFKCIEVELDSEMWQYYANNYAKLHFENFICCKSKLTAMMGQIVL